MTFETDMRTKMRALQETAKTAPDWLEICRMAAQIGDKPPNGE